MRSEARTRRERRRRDRRSGERREPGVKAVGAGEHAVQRRERPHGERQKVDAPPDAVRQLRPEPVRDPDGRGELGGDDAECDRERPVAGGEGDELLRERERDDVVEEQRPAVHHDEHGHRRREERVHLLDREPRPRGEPRAAGHQDAEDDAARQQQVRDDPGGARDVPGGAAHAATKAATGASRCHVSFTCTSPSRPTKRPGSPRRSSHDGPASPRRSATFAATSATTHRRAATVTSRQRASDGSPVDGSIRWWPPFHARLAMLLVARPPRSSVTEPPPGRPTTSGTVVAQSPPAETQPLPTRANASSTVLPLTTPFRSRMTSSWRRITFPNSRTLVAGGTRTGSTATSEAGKQSKSRS